MKRLVLTVALAVGFAAGFALAAVPAEADSVTYVRVSPAKGSTAQAIELDLPDGAFCPTQADRVIARLEGGNLTAPLNVTGNTAIKALDTMSEPGTAILPLLWTLQTAGGKVTPPVVLDGDFRLTVSCLAGLGQQTLGDSIADISIDAASGTYAVVSPIPQAAAAPNEPAQEPTPAQDGTDPEKSASQPETKADQSPARAGGDTRAGSSPDARGDARAEVPTAEVPASGESADEAALTALAASNDVQSAANESGSSSMRTVLIAGGVLLLAIVALLAIRARRQS